MAVRRALLPAEVANFPKCTPVGSIRGGIGDPHPLNHESTTVLLDIARWTPASPCGYSSVWLARRLATSCWWMASRISLGTDLAGREVIARMAEMSSLGLRAAVSRPLV